MCDKSRCQVQRCFAVQQRTLIKTSVTSSVKPILTSKQETNGQRKPAKRCAPCFKYFKKLPSTPKVEGVRNSAILRHGLQLKLHNFQYLRANARHCCCSEARHCWCSKQDTAAAHEPWTCVAIRNPTWLLTTTLLLCTANMYCCSKRIRDCCSKNKHGCCTQRYIVVVQARDIVQFGVQKEDMAVAQRKTLLLLNLNMALLAKFNNENTNCLGVFVCREIQLNV